ncbi:sensor histidine kinase [Bacteroidales bacterium]|nr:sensor histidine kinase [Bacteroidales bacterium]
MFFFLLPIQAVDIPNELIGNKAHEDNNFTIGLLVDTNRSLSIDHVAEMQNKAQLINSRYIIPSIEYDYWFILKLKNSGNSAIKQHIGFSEACLETVDMFMKDSTGWSKEKNGLVIPLEERAIYDRWPGFEIHFQPNEEKILYLKMHSKYLMPVSIMSKDIAVFNKEGAHFNFIFWLYFGTIVAILVFVLLLFVQLRDKIYLYYICYVICLLIWVSLDSGYFLYFSSNVKLYYFLSLGAPTMGAFITLFTREIIKVRQFSKWMDNTLIAISIIYFVNAVLVAFDVFFYQFLGIIAMPFFLFLLFVGFNGIFHKAPLSIFYVVASGFYIIGLFLYAGLTLGLIPYGLLSRYGYLMGSSVEMLVFMLALGYRVKLLHDEKARYKDEMIQYERTMKNSLEAKVKERTNELSEMLSALNMSNQKLQALSKFKEDMTATLVHDLKTPLSAIVNLEIETDKQHLGLFKNAGRKMLLLVQNILDVYKYENSEIKLSVSNTSPQDVIQPAIESVLYWIKYKRITLNYSLTNHILFEGDTHLLSRVIENILSNAVKYTKNEGSITIETVLQNDHIVFSVNNTGEPISEEKQNTIFQKFNQHNSKMLGKSSSSGLGLAFCKMIVSAHQGKISIKSNKDDGTTVSFYIPVNQEIKDIANDTNTPQLTENERIELQEVYPKLSNMEVNEISRFKKIFAYMQENKLANKNWLIQLESSVYACNKEKFHKLIEQIKAK